MHTGGLSVAMTTYVVLGRNYDSHTVLHLFLKNNSSLPKINEKTVNLWKLKRTKQRDHIPLMILILFAKIACFARKADLTHNSWMSTKNGKNTACVFFPERFQIEWKSSVQFPQCQRTKLSSLGCDNLYRFETPVKASSRDAYKHVDKSLFWEHSLHVKANVNFFSWRKYTKSMP